MPDTELILEVLNQIEDAAEKILVRFESIYQVSDFTDNAGGMEKLAEITRRRPFRFLELASGLNRKALKKPYFRSFKPW